MFPRTAIIVLAIWVGWTSIAAAEINVAPSLEWLTCSAEVIVIGKVRETETTKGPHSVVYEDCVVNVQQVIKGDEIGKQVEFTVRRLGESPSIANYIESEEVLLFLSKSRDHGSETHLDGRLIPALSHRPLTIVDLARLPDDLYSKEMKAIRDKDELLQTIGRWTMSPVRQSLWREVPFDSPIFKKLWAGSACYLIVPAEEKYRAEFLELARNDSPYERAHAAAELAKFPGDKTEAVLRTLLDDAAETRSYYAADDLASVEYLVRAAAIRSLRALGKTVPDLPLTRLPTDEERRRLREEYWSKAFTAALSDDWTIAVQDGASKEIDGRSRTIVKLECVHGDERGMFILVPKEWPRDERPQAIHLGIHGPSSQGGRDFYLEGDLDATARSKVVEYFGLSR